MNKNDIIATTIWLSILSVIAYNIGIVQTIVLILALIVAAALYMGLP